MVRGGNGRCRYHMCLFLPFCYPVVDFWNRISLIYQLIGESCTEASCPTMTAGRKYEYCWRDNKKSKAKPLSAPEYFEKCAAWIEGYIDDEQYFPTLSLYYLITGSTTNQSYIQPTTTWAISERSVRIYSPRSSAFSRIVLFITVMWSKPMVL